MCFSNIITSQLLMLILVLILMELVFGLRRFVLIPFSRRFRLFNVTSLSSCYVFVTQLQNCCVCSILTNNNNNNNFKITQTISEQHTRKARNQGTKTNSRTGHCTHTSESAHVKVQNIFHGRNNITCSRDCKYRTAATVHTIETWFVSGV